ncbi:hypothetical protein D1872_36370 [compost metagenome]
MDTCDGNRWKLSRRNFYFYNHLTKRIDYYRIYDIIEKGNTIIFKGVKNDRAVRFKLNRRYINAVYMHTTMNTAFSRTGRASQCNIKDPWFVKWLGRRQIRKMNSINI